MYPVIVLALSLLITVLLSVVFHHVYVMFQQQFNHLPEMFLLTLWIPPIAVAVIAIIFVAMISVRRFRANLRWRLPAFREASLAQLASALALMIEHGTPVTEALSLAESLEGSTVAGRGLALWRAQVEAGVGKPEHWRVAAFPPLFLWLVRSAGENRSRGLEKADR